MVEAKIVAVIDGHGEAMQPPLPLKVVQWQVIDVFVTMEGAAEEPGGGERTGGGEQQISVWDALVCAAQLLGELCAGRMRVVPCEARLFLDGANLFHERWRHASRKEAGHLTEKQLRVARWLRGDGASAQFPCHEGCGQRDFVNEGVRGE